MRSQLNLRLDPKLGLAVGPGKRAHATVALRERKNRSGTRPREKLLDSSEPILTDIRWMRLGGLTAWA